MSKVKGQMHGGNPCKRCELSPNPSACTYNASRRRGKRKADESNAGWRVQQTGASGLHISFDSRMNFADQLSSSLNGKDAIIWDGIDGSAHDMAVISPDQSMPLESNNVAQTLSPGWTEFLHSLGPSSVPPGLLTKDVGICPESCFISIHFVTNQLSSISNSKYALRLDKAFSILKDSIIYATKYSTCEHCDSGCTRLMTLSYLHQWQINALSHIANDPAIFFGDESPQLEFGEYKASADDNVAFKQMIFLRLTRNIQLALDRFQEKAKDYEEQFLTGKLELGEAGKLNLEWLLKVGLSLKKQAESVRVIHEKSNLTTV